MRKALKKVLKGSLYLVGLVWFLSLSALDSPETMAPAAIMAAATAYLILGAIIYSRDQEAEETEEPAESELAG